MSKRRHSHGRWSKGVKKRDKFKCQVCGSVKLTELEAHHLNGHTAETTTRIKAGITLCHYCHTKYHSEHEINESNFIAWRKKQMSAKNPLREDNVKPPPPPQLPPVHVIREGFPPPHIPSAGTPLSGHSMSLWQWIKSWFISPEKK